jgi:hypothetical protein
MFEDLCRAGLMRTRLAVSLRVSSSKVSYVAAKHAEKKNACRERSAGERACDPRETALDEAGRALAQRPRRNCQHAVEMLYARFNGLIATSTPTLRSFRAYGRRRYPRRRFERIDDALETTSWVSDVDSVEARDHLRE